DLVGESPPELEGHLRRHGVDVGDPAHPIRSKKLPFDRPLAHQLHRAPPLRRESSGSARFFASRALGLLPDARWNSTWARFRPSHIQENPEGDARAARGLTSADIGPNMRRKSPNRVSAARPAWQAAAKMARKIR